MELSVLKLMKEEIEFVIIIGCIRYDFLEVSGRMNIIGVGNIERCCRYKVIGIEFFIKYDFIIYL